MSTWVVLPTYNERGTLPTVLQDLFSLPIPLHVLVVDDHSPDGTGELADALCERYPNLAVLHRATKDGLGKAYLAGFQNVLDRGADTICEMDADGSHPVKQLPQLLAELHTADCVLGSRYVAGGSVENWDWFRRAISKIGNWYARLVLGIPVHDVTGGMKCFRSTTLRSLDFQAINAIGYCFQIEVTYRLWRKGKTIRELPITFTERQIGKSKFHLGIVWESIVNVWRLRFRVR